MTADSTALGFLAPLSTPPAEDADLDALFKATVTALCGLPTAMVWRKWQDPEPPQPDRTVTWCAFGILSVEADLNPSIIHIGDGDGGQGVDVVQRTERFDLLCSFYGPACRSAATALRDGIRVGQNRDVLRQSGIVCNGMDTIRAVPDLQNNAYVRRADLILRFSRMVSRAYPVRNVAALSGQGAIIADGQSVSGPAILADPL